MCTTADQQVGADDRDRASARFDVFLDVLLRGLPARTPVRYGRRPSSS